MFWLTGNVAYGKKATQGPRTYSNHLAPNAIDGSHDPRLGFGCCAYAGGASSGNPTWWQVAGGDTYAVISVHITNMDSHRCKLSPVMILAIGRLRYHTEISCNSIQYYNLYSIYHTLRYFRSFSLHGYHNR